MRSAKSKVRRTKNEEQIVTQCRFIEHQNKYKLGEIKNEDQRTTNKEQPTKNKEQIVTQCRFIEHQNKYKLGEIKNEERRTKNKVRRTKAIHQKRSKLHLNNRSKSDIFKIQLN